MVTTRTAPDLAPLPLVPTVRGDYRSRIMAFATREEAVAERDAEASTT